MIDFTKDTHIHTHFSPDADPKATFEKYIEKALELGITELTFTDHVDFDAVHPLFHNMIDYSQYILEFNRVKKTSPIPIHLGVEIGYQEHTKDLINKFLETYEFEHIILSIHYLERKDLYTGEYFIGKTKSEAYSNYFKTCKKAIKDIPNFDTFGHLDYITRYSQMGDYDNEEFKNDIEEILELLIKKGKGIEINTSGFEYENRPYPKYEVVRRYLELGGNRIFLGSDTHCVADLGRFFNKVRKAFS